METATETLVVYTPREHFEKYAALAAGVGVERLIPLVPDYGQRFAPGTKADRMRVFLAQDPHLNNVPIKLWDAVSGLIETTRRRGYFPTGTGVFALLHAAVREGRLPKPTGGFSSSDCVSLLKHVAIYHVAGATFEEES